MGMKDILCDGYGFTGLSSGLFGTVSKAMNVAGEVIGGLFESDNKTSFTDNLSNATKKTVFKTPKIDFNNLEAEKEQAIKSVGELKLENLLNEDNMRFLPKEAPGWWTANGGTYEGWAVKQILEGENREYDATH